MKEPWWWTIKLYVGRFLNLWGTNLELCQHCGKYTTWDERRLWGPYMLCPRCDRSLNEQLAAEEVAEKATGAV